MVGARPLRHKGRPRFVLFMPNIPSLCALAHMTAGRYSKAPTSIRVCPLSLLFVIMAGLSSIIHGQDVAREASSGGRDNRRAASLELLGTTHIYAELLFSFTPLKLFNT